MKSPELRNVINEITEIVGITDEIDQVTVIAKRNNRDFGNFRSFAHAYTRA